MLAGVLRLAGSVPLVGSTRRTSQRTVSGTLEIEVGGREIHLIEVGAAHTPGDLLVWVPDDDRLRLRRQTRVCPRVRPVRN
jgi:glyoxylase-like metal-dependent hydrolase (beta-lactamase superfamily II)